MSGVNGEPDHNAILRTVQEGDSPAKERLADQIAQAWQAGSTLGQLPLEKTEVRRWAREHVLQRLGPDHAAELADRLITFPEDFTASQRDRTAEFVVARISLAALERAIVDLAHSNVTGALWDRIAQSGMDAVLMMARNVLRIGSLQARETTLHTLALDPYGPQYLDRGRQNQLLQQALADSDPEIRGLAAEVVAVDLPERLLERETDAALDSSERVRMAYWRTAFAYRREMAFELASQIVLDPSHSIDARRTALLSLGEHVPTRQVSPVLQVILRGNEQVLAEDAGQLMWRYHRAPDVANAAAESQFSDVRELADRLLHPERGSPAAGGSRPGDPTRTTELFDDVASSQDWHGPERDEQ